MPPRGIYKLINTFIWIRDVEKICGEGPTEFALTNPRKRLITRTKSCFSTRSKVACTKLVHDFNDLQRVSICSMYRRNSSITGEVSAMRRPEVIKMPCAFPPDVRGWLEKKAALNVASMNSVIVAALREKMDAERRQERAKSSGTTD